MCSSTNHEHTRAGVLRTPTKQRNKGDHAKRSPKRFTQSTGNGKQENTPKIPYQLKARNSTPSEDNTKISIPHPPPPLARMFNRKRKH